MANNKRISDQLLAAYLDGNSSPAETLRVLGALKTDHELRETLDIALAVDDKATYDILPMTELAAQNQGNICSVLCEAFVLHRRDVPFSEQELLDMAKTSNWLKPQGAPIHSIGQLLAHCGLMVTRRYNACTDDILNALQADNDVIVAVDSDKLYPGREDPDDAVNHAVVVLGVDKDRVSLFDPSGKEPNVRVAVKDFTRAWNESKNYMVRVLQSIEDYEPQPINMDDIELTDDLVELREAIAENAHEVWAAARKKEGWTYGKVRNDEHKKHPDLIPYSALPDSEKEYDRIMALNTIKLVKKLGFEIVKNKK